MLCNYITIARKIFTDFWEEVIKNKYLTLNLNLS